MILTQSHLRLAQWFAKGKLRSPFPCYRQRYTPTSSRESIDKFFGSLFLYLAIPEKVRLTPSCLEFHPMLLLAVFFVHLGPLLYADVQYSSSVPYWMPYAACWLSLYLEFSLFCSVRLCSRYLVFHGMHFELVSSFI